MPQYHPCGRAAEIDWLSARITQREFEEALAATRSAGVARIDPPRRVFALL
jgi:putative pyruvate formate lyase activating enzyme